MVTVFISTSIFKLTIHGREIRMANSKKLFRLDSIQALPVTVWGTVAKFFPYLFQCPLK
jgi:hypothetical protein